MTFAALRSLHTLIGDALDDIERVYADASLDSSPAPTTPYVALTSPCTPYRRRPPRSSVADDPDDNHVPFPASLSPQTPRRPRNSGSLDSVIEALDFPPLDKPYYPTEVHAPDIDAAESLASHPDVIAASGRIVAACGQISATIHRPFLTLCDAAMGVRISLWASSFAHSATHDDRRTSLPASASWRHPTWSRFFVPLVRQECTSVS